MTHSGLVVSGLSAGYGSLPVLTEFDMSVAPGEVVALMGPSGSGKSTLLACATGMMRPTSGRVQLGGCVISELNPTGRARARRRSMGLVFQSPDLLPELTVSENVALTLLFDGVSRGRAIAAAEKCLMLVGLAGHGQKRVDEISGGEAQRVALARALVRPEVQLIVADEPTASLDADNAVLITDLLLSHARSMGAGALVATHDPVVAAACDRTLRLRESFREELSA
jgi:putative ABC transport system ATP-binding protein